jgi:hypothetical protein
MEFVDLPPGSLLGLGEELKDEAIGLTLIIDPNRHSKFAKWDGPCRLCKYRHHWVFDIPGGWVPPAIRKLRLAKALTYTTLGLDFTWKNSRVYVTLQGEYGLFRAQEIPARYDCSRARLWIDNCMEHHVCCGREEVVVKGIRMIDCCTGRIVEAEPASRWVALSYVWGQDASTESTQRPPEAGGLRCRHSSSNHRQRKRTTKYYTKWRIECHFRSLQQLETP